MGSIPKNWTPDRNIDACVRLRNIPNYLEIEKFKENLYKDEICGAVFVSEVDDFSFQKEMYKSISGYSEHFYFVPIIDFYNPNVLDEISFWESVNIKIQSLSCIGKFLSPFENKLNLKSFFFDHIESKKITLIVEPTLFDAVFLAELCYRYQNIKIVVRGSLITGKGKLQTDFIKKMPSPDRFTFDRLHQLPNVSLLLSSHRTRRVKTEPASPPTGWHSIANFFALFGPHRLIWGSEHDFSTNVVYNIDYDRQFLKSINKSEWALIRSGNIYNLLNFYDE